MLTVKIQVVVVETFIFSSAVSFHDDSYETNEYTANTPYADRTPKRKNKNNNNKRKKTAGRYEVLVIRDCFTSSTVKWSLNLVMRA